MAKRKGSTSTPGINREKREVTFDYIKSSAFRVVHGEGAFGGSGPRGNTVQFSVFSERWPIPKQTTHKLTETGDLSDEITERRNTRDAIMREVEVQIVMSTDNARVFAAWLNKVLARIDDAKAKGVVHAGATKRTDNAGR